MTHYIYPWAIRVTRFQRMHLAILAVFTSSLITGCAKWGADRQVLRYHSPKRIRHA